MVAKTHNYARENRRHVERWARDIQPYATEANLSLFDLFYWEHRLGNWASNSLMNSYLLTDLLDPFNCRELMEIWLRVPREKRMNCNMHKEIIKRNWPDLLELPINPGDRFNFLDKNTGLYYAAVWAKWFHGKLSRDYLK